MATRLVAFGGPSMFRVPGFRCYDTPVSHPYGILCPEHGSFRPSIQTIEDLVFPARPFRRPRSSEVGALVRRRKSLKTVAAADAAKRNGEEEAAQTETDTSNNDFRVSLDVSHFLPEELSVKTNGNKVVVHGRHEEQRDDEGYIEREFTRTYLLPDDVDPETVRSSLSGNGRLCIEAPRTRSLCLEASSPPGKVLPIEHMDVEKTDVQNAPAQE